jgi:hypothetical protein
MQEIQGKYDKEEDRPIKPDGAQARWQSLRGEAERRNQLTPNQDKRQRDTQLPGQSPGVVSEELQRREHGVTSHNAAENAQGGYGEKDTCEQAKCSPDPPVIRTLGVFRDILHLATTGWPHANGTQGASKVPGRGSHH